MLIIVVLIFLEENFGDLSKNFNRLMCTFGFELLAFTYSLFNYVKIIILQVTPKSENLQKIRFFFEAIIKTHNYFISYQ